MKTTKKLLAMALAVAMVVTAFAGCSGNNDTSSDDSTSSASSEASTSSDASTSDESSATEDDGTIHPMRIVQPGTLCPDYETGMAAVNEKLKEDGVNIEVSVTRIPWDAYAEKLNLMLTTGEEFELLHVMQDVKNLSAIAGMGAISSIHDSIQNLPGPLQQVLRDRVAGHPLQGRRVRSTVLLEILRQHDVLHGLPFRHR